MAKGNTHKRKCTLRNSSFVGAAAVEHHLNNVGSDLEELFRQHGAYRIAAARFSAFFEEINEYACQNLTYPQWYPTNIDGYSMRLYTDAGHTTEHVRHRRSIPSQRDIDVLDEIAANCGLYRVRRDSGIVVTVKHNDAARDMTKKGPR